MTWESVGVIAGIVGVPLILQQTWVHLVQPLRKRTKLTRAFALIEAWFDEVDRTVEHGLDIPLIDNMERKVDAYLRDHELERHPLRFSVPFRRQFLQEMGLKEELRNSVTLFEDYARSPSDGTDLGTWWGMTRGAFYRFSAAYRKSDPDTNFADVQMRILLLRRYLRIKSR